jgi:hypothetical protein
MGRAYSTQSFVHFFQLETSAYPVKEEKVDCFQCKHFFVTWDKAFPRGCGALGFKSREMPYQMVRQTSGMSCLRFERKRLPSK